VSDCQVCTRPAPDAQLCRSCVDQLAVELRAVPWLVDQLTITLTRQARVSDRNGGRSSENPLPFHLAASIDLETLRDGLAAWAGAVAEQRGIQVDAARDPRELARWLRRWIGELAQHPDASELHGDILAMTHAARRTIDRAPDLRFVGPCDGHRASTPPTEPSGCGEDLYVGVNAREAVCRTDGCGAVYGIQDRRTWLREQAEDQLRTARQLAYELPWIAGVVINVKTIGMWAARGKITRYLPHPNDEDQASRFRVGEVIDHAQKMAEEEAARHANGAA
jgi:hypothetical protein